MKTRFILLLLPFLLPFISCGSNKGNKLDKDAEFEYREIYLPGHGNAEYKALGLDNLEEMWGLWGHNLADVLPKDPSSRVFAKKGTVTHHEQFCFSSNTLYDYITNYISDNFGEEETKYFAILPNDNRIVCTCERCLAAGNTDKDASPAIIALIERLANRFPNHKFFTSYYSSARSIPNHELPENAGVLISAIDYPLSTDATMAENQFMNLLDKWKAKTQNIYVWDYINNFDDYFTPFPVFGAMQRRLQLYDSMGVKGVFLNGSGDDYSSLSRLKMHVLAKLLQNPNIDWKEELIEKSQELYPVTGQLIADFMIAQEDYVESNHSELPLYKGISEALVTYLPQDAFISFQDNLEQLLPKASKKEQKELEILSKALEMTRLEIMRHNNQLEGHEQRLDHLESLADNDIEAYNESYWTIPSYIRDYKYMLAFNTENDGNKLQGKKLEALNKMDPDYNDISILTDGLLGMPSNYHNGLLINSPDNQWSVALPDTNGGSTLRIWLATNKAFRIGLPQKIELIIDDNIIKTVIPKPSTDHSGHTFVEIPVPSSREGTKVLRFVRDPEVHSFAIEEIELI